MSPEGALITGVLTLSAVVGVTATVELATTTADTALHAVDTGEHVARDLGLGSGIGLGGGLTVTVAVRRTRKGGGAK